MANADIYELPDEAEPAGAKEAQVIPLYQIYDGSRIAVSKNVGPYWKSRLQAALKAYEQVHKTWDEVMKYYNNNQNKSLDTPRGVFSRGDSSENILYSNLNVMLPAVYSKDPDITCSTIDAEDEDFCVSLQNLLNVLFRRRDKLNAKQKIKRAAGFGLLTNFGIFKLDFTFKDDSREYAQQELRRITDEMKKAKNDQEVSDLYGQMQALEMNMELFEASGPSLKNVLPHRLIIDPYAEDQDGMDSTWMIEEIYHNTAALNARFTKNKKKDGKSERVLMYKPTHKAVFAEGVGQRDDGLGMVFNAIEGAHVVEGDTDEERRAFIHSYYTKCYLVWDKIARRVMLFHCDDWQWPIWVWDDPFNLSRFFPYYILSYGMSTGGVVSAGEPAYILDQQDEINDINRQIVKIRKTLFDFWLYNADSTNKDEATKFADAIAGRSIGNSPKVLGIRAGEGKKVSDMFECVVPPSAAFEPFFNKGPILEAINRISNTSDALRGTQFKAGTTEDAVQTYQEAARLAVGAKVDVIEDAVADMAYSLAELCVQHYSQEDVEKLIGKRLAKGWQELSLEQFRSEYTLTLVAGSMEKPNSVFKKKEALQIGQTLGQFAQAAPGATLRIMLKALSKAFTEVVIQKEDWDSLDQEIQATLSKGVSTPGAEGAAPAEAGGADALMEAAKQLPSEAKAQIMQMNEQGVPPEEIAKFIQTQVARMQQGGA